MNWFINRRPEPSERDIVEWLKRAVAALNSLNASVARIADTLAEQSDPARLRELADRLDAKTAEWQAKVTENTPGSSGPLT